MLSLANIEEDEHDHEKKDDAVAKRKVSTDPGRAIGYQRCWAQRSADHRGTTEFNGIVCTLLSDEEVWRLHHPRNGEDCGEAVEEKEILLMQSMRPSMTEGLIYTVDEDLVDDCLAELDFREKGVSFLIIVWFLLSHVCGIQNNVISLVFSRKEMSYPSS